MLFFVRIFELKARLQSLLDKVKLRPVDIRQALGIDNDFNAVTFPNRIVFVGCIGKFKFISHARAPGRFDAES